MEALDVKIEACFQVHNDLGNSELATGFFGSTAHEQGVLSAVAHGSLFFLG
jgi:hypothetical protein